MNNKILIPMLLADGLTTVNTLQATEKTQRGLYLGLFGGGSTSDSSDFAQSGVAFKRVPIDPHSYNLNVDVKGSSDNKTGALGGLHLGYEFMEIPLSSAYSEWGLRPAVELEGYYLGTSRSGMLSNPQTELGVLVGEAGNHNVDAGSHVFKDSFNLDMGVLLANSVFTFKTPWSKHIFPYIGGGVGAAITSVSKADSAQYSPGAPELSPYINHFNSNTNATSSSFATQAKVGIRAEIFDQISVFAEYRYLYVSATNYTFGSTVYPGIHSQTSVWDSHFSASNFHSGVLGFEYGF